MPSFVLVCLPFFPVGFAVTAFSFPLLTPLAGAAGAAAGFF